MDATRRTNISQKKVYFFDLIQFLTCAKKRSMITTVKKGKGARASSSKKASYDKNNARKFPIYRPSHA